MTTKKEPKIAEDNQRALLIEDDIFCQKVQQHCLIELGYIVEVVGDAKTAIERVGSQFYDLIVLDLGLPDQSGEKVITAARNFLPNLQTPLIVATAHADPYSQQKCLHLGADVVFIKPFTKQTLAKAIDYCHAQFNKAKSVY